MTLHLSLLLLAAAGVLANTQSGNSQAAIDHVSSGPGSSPLITAPAELVPVSAENRRFSRLLKDSANVLQFSSISNDAPPIWGIARDDKKEAKQLKFAKKNSSAGANFGRRALDYDEQIQAFEETTSESRIIANPYPGNEYVYVHPGRLVQASADSDAAASVTSINNKPPRVPLALLRQKKGKRVNISPLFTEVPQVHQDGKEFVWVDQPDSEHQQRYIGVNRQGRKHDEDDEATTNPAFQEEDLLEATTLADEIPIETTTAKQNRQKLIVNVVTSAPRFSVESSVGERKPKRPRVKSTSTTTTTTTDASTTTTSEASTEPSTPTTTFVSTTTFQAPTATNAPIPISSSSPKAISADEKENLVADAFHRSGSSFHGFEDSQTKLQTAESSQPARVNVRPAQNGKEYEYEYIYYYYDDDDAEKAGEGKAGEGKVAGHPKDAKSAPSSAARSSAPSTAAVTSDDPSSVTVAITSSSTTSTTTIAPDLTSDADFEYEDDAEEEIKVNSQAPELQKSTPSVTRTTDEPVHKGVSSAEKLSNSNPLNQLDRSRGPKILPGKFDESVADYKLETEASQEDEVVQTQAQSKGQPQLIPQTTSSEEEEQIAEIPAPVTQFISREPSTSAPGPSTAGFDTDNMSTLAKTHKDSVNTPIILKQSSLLKAVPVSQLQPNPVQLPAEQPSTAPFVTPTTTAPTVEAASEAVPSVRPSPPRLRGHRLRGSVTPRPSTSTSVAAEQPAEEKPQQAVRRPHLRESSRRIPSRRPAPENSETAVEQQPAASPIIEAHARPLPIRPRFPPRTHTTTTATAPVEVTVASELPPVTVSAAELNTLDDKRAKDAHVRAKSANDLFAFARLQQAISSRAPSRVQPKLVAGFVNSGEVTTDAIISSEVTTVSSFGGQSGESLGVVSVEPTTTTTTTTTTEAAQLDKFGRQRGGPRFGGRTRKPIGGGSGSGATTTTEAPATQPKGRFTGRRRTSTTESPEGTVQQTSDGANTNETPKPRIPARNRFATRNRASTTEATTATGEQQKTTDSEKPAVTQPRRRPGTFQGRRRPNQIQGQAQTESTVAQEETASTAAVSSSSSAAAVTTTAAPAAAVAPGRNRFNFAGAGGRPRPGAAAANAPGSNPVRIRGGGRLRGPTTTTTTEAAPAAAIVEEGEQEQPADAEQSQSIQTEHLEQPIQTPPASDSVAPARGSGGVLGRLKNRPKLVVTTTTSAPDVSGDRKPSRLNGILNRRKNLGHSTAPVQVKEEVRESTSEVAEEANNHAQEQEDDHKGVVVQISSSVTESEEVNEAHAGEIVEPPSTTPGSILNRLKSQRKPGSLFRKKPDPHGE